VGHTIAMALQEKALREAHSPPTVRMTYIDNWCTVGDSFSTTEAELSENHYAKETTILGIDVDTTKRT
jgi:hypothetical protein